MNRGDCIDCPSFPHIKITNHHLSGWLVRQSMAGQTNLISNLTPVRTCLCKYYTRRCSRSGHDRAYPPILCSISVPNGPGKPGRRKAWPGLWDLSGALDWPEPIGFVRPEPGLAGPAYRPYRLSTSCLIGRPGLYPFARNNGFPRAYKPSFKSVCQQRHNKEHEKSREFILGALLCKNFI